MARRSAIWTVAIAKKAIGYRIGIDAPNIQTIDTWIRIAVYLNSIWKSGPAWIAM